MEHWETFLRKLVEPPISELHLARGSDIKNQLNALSKFPFDPSTKTINIRDNSDLARNEFIGSAQRYLYGHFLDSILYSCFSVEFALLVKLDAVLSDSEKRALHKPLMLGEIIGSALRHRILNDRAKVAAEKVQAIRNVHIHGANFISAIVRTYKSRYEPLKAAGITPEMIGQGLESYRAQNPNSPIVPLLVNIHTSDLIQAFKTIETLSTFEWCANHEALEELEREAGNAIDTIVASVLNQERDAAQKIMGYNILKDRATRAINEAQIVFESLGLL